MMLCGAWQLLTVSLTATPARHFQREGEDSSCVRDGRGGWKSFGMASLLQ